MAQATATDLRGWERGDRIVISSTQKHGAVYSISNNDDGIQTVRVLRDDLQRNPINQIENITLSARGCSLFLQHESPLPASRQYERAPALYGTLLGPHRAAFNFVLEVCRFLVASDDNSKAIDGCLKTTIVDIEQLLDPYSSRTQCNASLNVMTAKVWSTWSSFSNQSMPDLLTGLMDDLSKQADDAHLPPEYSILARALHDDACIPSWERFRVTGDFWIVGVDTSGSGTYIVADANHMMVFKVLSPHPSSHNELLSCVDAHDRRPVKVKLTFVPWCGRLVLDGAIPFTLEIEKAPCDLSQSLVSSVKAALAHGLVLDRFRELEMKESPQNGWYPASQNQMSPFEELSPSRLHEAYEVVSDAPSHSAPSPHEEARILHDDDSTSLSEEKLGMRPLIPPRYDDPILDRILVSPVKVKEAVNGSRSKAGWSKPKGMKKSKRSNQEAPVKEVSTGHAVTSGRSTQTEETSRTSVTDDCSSSAALCDTSQSPSTLLPPLQEEEEELSLLRMLFDMDSFPPEGFNGWWVLRRNRGNHKKPGSTLWGQGMTLRTIPEEHPSTLQILRAVVHCTRLSVWRPSKLFVDSLPAWKRLDDLIKTKFRERFIKVYYIGRPDDGKHVDQCSRKIAKQILKECKWKRVQNLDRVFDKELFLFLRRSRIK